MAPHRAAAAAPAAWAVVLGALGGAAVGFHGVAFAVLLLTMMLDLLTGTRRARRNPGERYDREVAFAGIESKGRRVILVVLAFSADVMLVSLSHMAGRAEGIASHFLISGAAIAAQYVTEGYSVIDNVRRTEGAGVGLIVQVLVAAFERLRFTDDERHREIHGRPAPRRREIDRRPDVVAEAVAPAVTDVAPAVSPTTPGEP